MDNFMILIVLEVVIVVLLTIFLIKCLYNMAKEANRYVESASRAAQSAAESAEMALYFSNLRERTALNPEDGLTSPSPPPPYSPPLESSAADADADSVVADTPTEIEDEIHQPVDNAWLENQAGDRVENEETDEPIDQNQNIELQEAQEILNDMNLDGDTVRAIFEHFDVEFMQIDMSELIP